MADNVATATSEVVKHLVTCTCILTPLKHHPAPPVFRFLVVSVVNPEGQFVAHLDQCPNCGVIHQVTEVGKTRVLEGKSSAAGVLDQDEIRGSLPEKLVAILDRNQVPSEVFREVYLVWTNELWGKTVILSKEEVTPGVWSGKKLLMVGKTLWRVDSWTREDTV